MQFNKCQKPSSGVQNPGPDMMCLYSLPHFSPDQIWLSYKFSNSKCPNEWHMLIHEINQLPVVTTPSMGRCRREANTRRAVVGLSRVDSLATLHFTKVHQDVERPEVLCQHQQMQNLKSHTWAQAGISERCKGKKSQMLNRQVLKLFSNTQTQLLSAIQTHKAKL